MCRVSPVNINSSPYVNKRNDERVDIVLLSNFTSYKKHFKEDLIRNSSCFFYGSQLMNIEEDPCIFYHLPGSRSQGQQSNCRWPDVHLLQLF